MYACSDNRATICIALRNFASIGYFLCPYKTGWYLGPWSLWGPWEAQMEPLGSPGFSQFPVTRCQGVKVSGCKGVKVSRCQGVKVSGCQCVKVLGCQGIKVSGCQCVKVTRSQGVKASR